MFEKFCWKKRNETNVFQLCCGKKNYVGYVGWENLESYVEMVAGLPKDTKMIRTSLLTNVL